MNHHLDTPMWHIDLPHFIPLSQLYLFLLVYFNNTTSYPQNTTSRPYINYIEQDAGNIYIFVVTIVWECISVTIAWLTWWLNPKQMVHALAHKGVFFIRCLITQNEAIFQLSVSKSPCCNLKSSPILMTILKLDYLYSLRTTINTCRLGFLSKGKYLNPFQYTEVPAYIVN